MLIQLIFLKKLVSLLLNSKDNEPIIHNYDEALAV
jgi:hypothetical protein